MSKAKLILIAFIFLTANASAQQLQQRDKSAMDLDSVDIETVQFESAILVDLEPKLKGKSKSFASYIKEQVVYPSAARVQHNEGIVYVSYVINVKGRVQYVSIIQTSNPIFNDAAIKVVSESPKWKPATYKGKPVEVKKVARVIFKL